MFCVGLTGVHPPSVGGGAEAPGDPAAAAAARTGHAAGECLLGGCFPLHLLRLFSKWPLFSLLLLIPL